MKVRRVVLPAVITLYAAGLTWGYWRLPWAAVKSLHDYSIIAEAPAVSLAEVDVSGLQLGYLRGALPVSTARVVPRVSVAVAWYAVVIARVRSGHFLGPEGAERRDALYVCLFGAWIPIYTYGVIWS